MATPDVWDSYPNGAGISWIPLGITLDVSPSRWLLSFCCPTCSYQLSVLDESVTLAGGSILLSAVRLHVCTPGHG